MLELLQDAGMIKQFDDLAERQFMIAKNIASQETTTKKLPTSRFIEERRSSGTGLHG